MISYLLLLLPLTFLFLLSLRLTIKTIKWTYRGLLLIAISGIYLTTVFALAAYFLEQS